jgi:hypothetical protein
VARQRFADDRDLAHLIEIKTAVAPEQSTVATCAGELAATVVQDVADNLLPESALAQSRAVSLASSARHAGVAGGLRVLPGSSLISPARRSARSRRRS